MTVEERYAGFWRRAAASVIDSLLLLPLLVLMLYAANRADQPGLGWVLLQDLVPMALVVFFWIRYGGTPGKRLLECEVVDAHTGARLTAGRAVLRYLGYILSTLPLGLGFFWVAWDRRKQGFHDKIANTVVVHRPADESRKSLDQLMGEPR